MTQTETTFAKDGQVIHNGQVIGGYEFDQDADCFWVNTEIGGQQAINTKAELITYFLTAK